MISVLGFISALVLSALSTSQVFAAGDAYFSLSPSGGSYTVGSTFTVNVSEKSSASDNVNAVQASISYDSSKLQYISSSLGDFTLCTSNSGGGGSVNLACAATSTQTSGTVVYVTFKAIASGSASFNLGSSSDIDSTSGSSVWDHNTKSASFNISAPAAASSSSSTKSSSTPAPTPPPSPTSKPTTTTPTTPTTQTGSNTTQLDNAAVTIIVMDTNGQPVNNAKVTLDGSTTMYTNSQGKANFSVESAGSHNVTVTAPGKKPYTTKVTLTANQSIPLELQLTAASSNGALYGAIGVIGALVLLGTGFYFFRAKLPFLHKNQFIGVSATQSPIAGYNSNNPTPAPQPVPVRPPSSSNGPQQRSSFGTDSVDGMRRRF